MKRPFVVLGATLALGALGCSNDPTTPAREDVDNASTAKVDAGGKRTADASVRTVADAASKSDAGKSDAGSGQLSIPPLTFRSRKLPNGLTLYSAKDSNTARVTVQVWYKVGSKDDPEGRSGFAHLFEHLMFKATRNLPPETLDRLTEDVGGSNNAFTADDTTAYYEIVPGQHLERILFAEADRMGSLVVDEAAFVSERDVVKEELRQRVLADPYGRLFSVYLTQESFDDHPYRRPGIGNIAELDAANLKEVLDFHATFYRPDNAYLIVAGDFDEAQLDAWVDAYFGKIARPSRPLPKNDVPEPKRTSARSATYYAPNVPLPAVALSFQLPRYADADAAALLVLDDILSTGASSRLYHALVYEQQSAAEAGSSIDLQQQAGTLLVYALMSEGHDLDEGEAALLAELDKLRTEPVTAAELEEAKRELVAGTLRSREGVLGRARELGYSLILAGDPAAADRQLAAVQKVSAADVLRVAKKYLDPERRVTVRYLDDGDKPADAPAEPRQPATGAPIKLVDLAASGEPVVLAPEGERAQLPGPQPARDVPTPEVSEQTLANGLRVLVAPTHDVPLVSARLTLRTGAADDPADKAGLASFAAGLLSEGTSTKKAPEIAAELESLGAVVGASAGYDFTGVSANSPADVFPKTAAVMAAITRDPAFADEELARAQQQSLDGLRVSLTEPSSIAGYVVGRVLFGASPYGGAVSGTPASIPRITREDLVTFHGAHYRPSTAKLTFSGDIEPNAAFALADQLFGDWSEPDVQPAPAIDAAGPVPKPRVVVIDQPGSGQAAVYAAARAIARTDPTFYPLIVGNTVLGAGYSSRLNQEIRLKRGLSYGASSSLGTRLHGGVFAASAQTRNDAAVQVSDLMLAELTRISSEPVPSAELDVRATALIGGFAGSLESVDGLVGQVASLAAYDLPLTELRDYPVKVRAVTAEQLKEAFGQKLPASAFSLIIVGDAAKFLPALKTKYPAVEVITVDELDLDSATLR